MTVYSRTTSPTLPLHPATPHVSVQGLTKTYARGRTATRDVRFDAYPGEIFGVLGPNGAGKTTTLRMLATLIQPTHGTALVAGHDITRAPDAVRRTIGVVNGGMGLYDRLTGRETLTYFGQLHGLDRDHIRRRIQTLADDLEMDDLLDRRASEYSTGMKQKVVIARAVLHDPQILILDEATSGLDVFARRAVLNYARTYRAQGRTVLYSTHVMSEAEELCDRAALMFEGEVYAQGALADLYQATNARSLDEAFYALLDARRTERKVH